jgi:response regulator RpfG family c-di-GMP phosphodiesterase
MPKALVITNQVLSPDPVLTRVLNDIAQCQWRDWEDLLPEDLAATGVLLVLADISSLGKKADSCLAKLSAGPLETPLLAILPADCSGRALQAVSAVATDFLFAPLREEELKLRALRLLGVHSSETEQAAAALREQLGLTQLVGNPRTHRHR